MAGQRNTWAALGSLYRRFQGNRASTGEADRGFTNNISLQWRNAADTANIDVINMDASNVTQFSNTNNFSGTTQLANNNPLLGVTAAGTGSVEMVRVDSDNILELGLEAQNPLRKTVQFNLAANGSLGNGGSAGSQCLFIADRAYTITAITEIHKTAGNDAGAVTLNVSKETGTQAPGAGATVQSGTFNLKGTANTLQTATLTATAANLTLAAGDRLSAVFAGVLTTLAGVVVEVVMTPASKAHQFIYFVDLNGDLSTQTVGIANRDMIVTGVQCIYRTAFGAAITIDVTKDTSTNAPGAGTSVLAATMAGDGAINTVLSPALAATAATLRLAAGDRIAIKYSATTTGAGVCLVVSFQPIYGDRKEVVWQLGPNAQQQVSQCFFLADRDYEVVELSETHATAAGGAATIKITIDKGTTVPGGGANIPGSTLSFNLNATANTVQFGDSTGAAIGATAARGRLLNAGDRLGINIASGAAQSIANVAVTASLVAR